MKKIFLFAIAVLSVGLVNAQQDAMFTHYSFNTMAINPAYAGTRDALSVTALNRNQWAGFEGAPVTQTITASAPLMGGKMGVGLSVINDRIGPLNSSDINVDLSYRIKINEQAQLSFGLKGGLNLLQARVNQLETTEAGDPGLGANLQTGAGANLGFGMYYYTSKWYVGVSAPKLLQNEFFEEDNASIGVFKQRRHYYVIGGTEFVLNENLKLKPSTFVKLTPAAPVEVDLTALFVLKDKFEGGAMFRTSDAAGLLLGYNINKQFRVGYAFDWSYGNTSFKYNGGSHELMIRYDFVLGNKTAAAPSYQ